MTRTPVASSNLASVGFDPLTSTLEIQFHSGDIYDYASVPAEIYSGLMHAGSKGKFFYANIRKGGYAYTKVFDAGTGQGAPEGASNVLNPLAPVTALGQILTPTNPLPELLDPTAPDTVSPILPTISDISKLSDL